MTLLTQPPSPNQPPVPTPAPPVPPAAPDPMAVIAAAQTAMAAVVAPNAATFKEQAGSIAGIGATLKEQVAIYNAPLPADEVWLRVYVGCCMGGRPDQASEQAAKAQAEYAARFRQTAG